MRAFWVTALIVLIDQLTKLAIYATMYRGQSIPVLGDWLRLTYTLNPGMAFGITFGPPGLITILALGATLLILVYIFHVRDGYAPYRYSLALILGGALGNIIDRIFYGKLFGYADLFQGQVVDFIHVNLWRGYIPESIPLLGGTYAALFPIWNVADMAIVIGVVGILLFQRTFHEEWQQAELDAAQPDTSHTEGDAVEAAENDESDAEDRHEGEPLELSVDPTSLRPVRWSDNHEGEALPPASGEETERSQGETATE